MVVKVVITRKFRQGSQNEALKAVREVRSQATLQQGYISGETLISEDDPSKVMVISSWISRKHWEEWRANPMRQEVANKLDELLEIPEQVECFVVGEKVSAWGDTP
jgi:heme-degrading monooxygenase HmoA